MSTVEKVAVEKEAGAKEAGAKEAGAAGRQRLELETTGWQRRFEAEAGRAGELTDLYCELGYEVTTLPIAPQEIGPECAGCAIIACQRYVALYTRRPR